MTDKLTFHVLQNKNKKLEQSNIGCAGCGSKTCKNGGFGIYPGAEKEIVYRNVFLYISMAIIIFTGTYLLIQLFTKIYS